MEWLGLSGASVTLSDCPCCESKTHRAINTKVCAHTVNNRRSKCIDHEVKRLKVTITGLLNLLWRGSAGRYDCLGFLVIAVTSPPRGVPGIVVSMSVCVCLSDHISRKLCGWTSPNFLCMLPMVVDIDPFLAALWYVVIYFWFSRRCHISVSPNCPAVHRMSEFLSGDGTQQA